MGEIQLRPATPEDADACAAILRNWINATLWLPNLHTPAEDIEFLHGKIRDEDVIVALYEAEIAGFLSRGGEEVSCLYVEEAHRSQGAGSLLIEAAQKEGPGHLTLWTFQENRGARRFYARHGFAEIALTDGDGNEEQLPDVRLEWRRENL